MCASSTLTAWRRTHIFVRGPMSKLQVHCPLPKERARGTQAHMSMAPLQMPRIEDMKQHREKCPG